MRQLVSFFRLTGPHTVPLFLPPHPQFSKGASQKLWLRGLPFRLLLRGCVSGYVGWLRD